MEGHHLDDYKAAPMTKKWRMVTRDEAAWTEIIKPMASLWLEVLNLMNMFTVTWISAGAGMKIDTKE